VYLFTADLAEPAQVRAAAAQIQAQFPVLDVLVNNAGVFKTKREDEQRWGGAERGGQFSGAVFADQFAAGQFGGEWNGRVVNVVSELYKQGNPTGLFANGSYKGQAAYANSKMACVYWSKQLGCGSGRSGHLRRYPPSRRAGDRGFSGLSVDRRSSAQSVPGKTGEGWRADCLSGR
jgi:NAD(P)-dependent dehydrogenase (short-subunit alcohol dehydrogenase family)